MTTDPTLMFTIAGICAIRAMSPSSAWGLATILFIAGLIQKYVVNA
jgi:hypothetical protein